MKDGDLTRKVNIAVPGKLMLMGEHAVVYGYPCIVSAVNKYLAVAADFSDKGKDTIATPGFSDQSFVKETIKIFRDQFHKKEPVSIETKSEIGGYGLGSSAAVVAATMQALWQLHKIKIDKKALFDLCYKVILNIQGSGSGFDVASAIYGGVLYYANNGKIIEPLNACGIPLVIGFSGTKADTVSQINLVKEKMDTYTHLTPVCNPKGQQSGLDGYMLEQTRVVSVYKEAVEKIFTNIAKLVDSAKQIIFEKDWVKLGVLLNYNQDYLEDLGISTEKLNKMILAARKAGAYGAKLSGAGGGDCMFALVSKEKEKEVAEAIKKAGGKIIDVENSAIGTKPEVLVI